MQTRESGEMYLETIYILSQKEENVRKIDVSKYMGFSKPSVTRGINLLQEKKLVEVDQIGNILLTKEGEKQAKNIYERHTVLTKMLVSLGVDEKTAADDACRMEHYISDTSFKAIKKHMKEYS